MRARGVGIEHRVIDDQLAASLEDVAERLRPALALEGVWRSTSAQGRSRRSRLSWSHIRVSSFSFARCLFRALSHSSCFTTLRVAM